jgi:glycosyltransferase involved in cell wall biosynthesis
VLRARHWGADWLHLQFAPGTFDRRRIVTLLPLVRRVVYHSPRVAVTLHEYGGWPIDVGPRLQPIVSRGLGAAERRGWLDRESLALLSASDLAIVTNADHVATIRARSPRLASRLSVIPIGPNVGAMDGVSTDRGEARTSLSVRPDQPVVTYFGFVHPVKGIETLIRSVRLARAHLPNLTLWIVGGVESLALRGEEAVAYERTIRSFIAAEGVADAVELTGFLPDVEVARRLAAADVAVLPFNHGATLKSGTLITSLSYGLPTVTTLGGNLHPLRHGEDVWLVPPRDSAALSEALVRLANDNALRSQLRRGALEASRNFAWSKIVRRHRDLYEGTVSNKSG